MKNPQEVRIPLDILAEGAMFPFLMQKEIIHLQSYFLIAKLFTNWFIIALCIG